MKLLSIAIPSYNSQDYLHHAVESLLPGGDEVEILIVDDGSKDRTAEIADDFERRYPGIVRAVHKENGGHGDAVMCGLQEASGLYFKVVDSDDWVDQDAYPKLLSVLRSHAAEENLLDLVISNFVYDKAGVKHKHVMRYNNALPQNRTFTWNEVGHFRLGQYLLMHSVIYRTDFLRSCHIDLPKHTFYVDDLYVYIPLAHVEKMYYLDVNFYHYFIGRDDQSVQENIMIQRIDQQLLVNRLMFERVDLLSLHPAKKFKYMRNYLEIITTVSTALLTKSGTEEALEKRQALWDNIRNVYPEIYKILRCRPIEILMLMPGALGRKLTIVGYTLSQKVFGFN